MNIYIETERFYIRELLPEDDEEMFKMDSDPEVHRYVGQAPVKSIEETREVIQFVRKQYEENGVGRWAVVEKYSDKFIGWTGFKLIKELTNGDVGHFDFGYRFTRSAWGRGIASESGKASLRYGVEILGFHPVFAMTDVNNAASRHVLEKLGFRFVEIFKYDGPIQWRTENDLTATWYELPNIIC